MPPTVDTPCRGEDIAWYVLASHNLSGAAWGKLQKKGLQLHIMHYEVRRMSLSEMPRMAPHICRHIALWCMVAYSSPATVAPAIARMQLAVLFVPSLETAWRLSPLRDFTCTPLPKVTKPASLSAASSPGEPVAFKAFRPECYNSDDAQQAAATEASNVVW